MPDKNPPAFQPGDFLCGKPHVDRHTCKSKHPGQGRRWTDFRSRFLYFCIVPSSPVGGFFAKNTCWQAARKRQTPRAAQAADRLPLPVSVFLHCPWLFQLGIFCEEHMLAGRPQKANTPNGAGSCSPHFSDSRIVLRSRRPGGLLRAVRVRQPDLDSGGHFRRDGLSPGSSPSGRGGGILPGQLQSGGISV